MHHKWPVFFLLACFAAAACGILAVAQEKNTSPASSAPKIPPDAQTGTRNQPRQSPHALKANTRLVTVDVVATDSHGRPVRDLGPQDFQIIQDRKVREDIAQFSFEGNAGNAEMAAKTVQPPPTGVYSNMPAAGTFAHAPTILLIDGINTLTPNQAQVRRNLVRALKTLPTGTPVAVFLLGSSLEMLQNFTTDTALLGKAVEQAVTATALTKNPQLDPLLIRAVAEMESFVQWDPNIPYAVATLQEFEQKQYAGSVGGRVADTTRALRSIAMYVSGYPGRKNLIWLSEAFPLYMGTRMGLTSEGDYREQVNSAARALADALIAVYPVDAKGLATW